MNFFIRKVQSNIWSVVLIAIVSVFVYSNTATNGYSIDDELVVYNHPQVMKGLDGIYDIFTTHYVIQEDHQYGYRPITKASFAIEYYFFGHNPMLSHLINALLYGFLCVMLFVVFKKIFRFTSNENLFLLLAVLLFAVHPIHTEVVASLKNREEILCFLFGLMAMYCFAHPFSLRKIHFYIFGFFFIVLSIITKQNGVVFAVLVPLQIYFFNINYNKEATFDIKVYNKIFISKLDLKNYVEYASSFIKNNSKKVLGFIILIFITFSISYLSIKVPETHLPTNSEVQYWHNPNYTQPTFERKVFLFLESNLFYLQKLIYPSPLLFYYGYNMFPLESVFTFKTMVSFLIFLFLMLIAIALIIKKHILSFSILFYFISISIFLNLFMPIAGIVAERFVFIASWGFCLGFVFLIFSFFKQPIVQLSVEETKNKPKLKKNYVPLVIFPFLLIFSYQTMQRNKDWKDGFSIVEADIKHLNNSFFANSYYATKLDVMSNQNSNYGVLTKMTKHYKRAIEIYPDYDKVWNNLGRIYFEEYQNIDSAKYYFTNAIRINPNNHYAQFHIAYINQIQGRIEEAKNGYLKTLNIYPKFENALLLLSNLYLYQFNKLDSAYYYNMVAANYYPNSESVLLNTGNFYLFTGDTLNAVEKYETAFSINPNNRNNAKSLYEYFIKTNNNTKADYYERYF